MVQTPHHASVQTGVYRWRRLRRHRRRQQRLLVAVVIVDRRSSIVERRRAASGHRRSIAFIALLIGVFAPGACRERPEARFARAYQEATLAVREGQVARAREISDRGLRDTAAQPDSDWAWKFRLLDAE